ncbi:MAG: TetR/AcrR family transcriptional regulator [Kineosporiaceae bacterium]
MARTTAGEEALDLRVVEEPAPPRRTPNPRGEGARLREELLDAADRLLSSGGAWAEISLRGVAREAGVAAPSVYAHFAQLEDLMLALAAEHQAGLEDAVARAASRPGGRAGTDGARIRAAARAYVRWGLTYPGAYTHLYGGPVMRTLAREDDRSFSASSVLLSTFADALSDLRPAPADPAQAALALWTALHGLVTLRVGRPGHAWPGQDRHTDLLVTALTGAAR